MRTANDLLMIALSISSHPQSAMSSITYVRDNSNSSLVTHNDTEVTLV
jgi:hypothetical protein